MPEIRVFARPHRDQLTELVNAHIAAVVPGWALPVSALLAQFEREPAQYVVNPWVLDRTTLVAVERDRIVAGAHLKRYGTDDRGMPDYHDASEIAWLVAWPRKLEAAHALARGVHRPARRLGRRSASGPTAGSRRRPPTGSPTPGRTCGRSSRPRGLGRRRPHGDAARRSSGQRARSRPSADP